MSGEKSPPEYSSKKVHRMCLTATLGSFLFGYNVGVVNSTLEVVASVLEWGDYEEILTAVVGGAMPFGAMISSLLAGKFSNRVGARKTLMVSNLITLVGTVITVIPYTLTFALGRFLSGLSVGVYAALVPLYINETSPTQMSGQMGILAQAQITFGIVVAYALALVLPTENYKSNPLTYWWMVMFGLQGVIAVWQFIVLLWFYKLETPLWLWNKGLKEDVLKSLKQVYTEESAYKALSRMEAAQKYERGLNSPLVSEKTYDPFYSELLLCKQNAGKLMRLGYSSNFFQQFSGINAILTFSTVIFAQLGGGVFTSRVYTLILGVLNMVPGLATGSLVDRFGRKLILVLGCLGMAACHFMSGFFAGPLSDSSIVFPLTCILAYIFFFSISIGPICWLYCGEILTPRAMSICTSVNWLCKTVVLFSFTPLKNSLGMPAVFWIYSGVCALGFLYFILDMVENKGLTKQEIQKLLVGESKID